MRRLFLITCLYFISHSAFAQYETEFIPGRLLTLEGDTVDGYLQFVDRGHVILKRLEFKTSKDAKQVIKYPPEKIKGFIIGDYEFYSKPHGTSQTFWLLLSKGPVRVLEERHNLADVYIPVPIPIPGGAAIAGVNKSRADRVYKMLEKATGENIVYNASAKVIDPILKQQLVRFFQDRTELSEVIAESEYEVSDIPLMVAAYNQPDKYKMLRRTKASN